MINCLFICFEIKEENRLNFIRLFYSFSLSKALMFIFAVFKSIQVKSQVISHFFLFLMKKNLARMPVLWWIRRNNDDFSSMARYSREFYEWN